MSQRQFYVGNTRYRGAHRIYVSHCEAIMRRLATPDPGRELATEFMHPYRMSRAEEIATRPLRRLGHRARYVWHAMGEQPRQMRETVRQKMDV